MPTMAIGIDCAAPDPGRGALAPLPSTEGVSRSAIAVGDIVKKSILILSFVVKL